MPHSKDIVLVLIVPTTLSSKINVIYGNLTLICLAGYDPVSSPKIGSY